MSWRWTAPDGSFCDLEDDVPNDVEHRMQLLKLWYSAKIAPFKEQYEVTQYETLTGEKFR